MTFPAKLGTALTVWVAACGGGDVPMTSDAGTDAVDALDTALSVTPIAPPSLPSWGCPDDWRSVSADDIALGLERCEPWPEDDAPCAPHEVRLPGDAACHSVGSLCPADGWPADLPGTGVLYVRPGAPEPPDGSRDAPFPSVESALSNLAAGTTTLALSVGDYAEQIHLDTSLRIRGACPEGTVLRGSVIPLTVDGAERVQIENLSLVGAVSGNLVLWEVMAEIRNIAFDNIVTTFSGPSTVFEDIVIRRTSAVAETALSFVGNGDVTLRRVLIEDTHGLGMSLGGDGLRTLTDVYMRRIGSAAMNLSGSVSLERVVIEDSLDTGLSALSGGRMKNVLVRHIVSDGVSTAGVVLVGDWDLEGVHFAGATDTALVLADGHFVVHGAILEGSSVATAGLGRGVVLGAGASLTAARMIIANTRDVGLFAGRRASASLTDVTIRRVDESLAGGFGRCLHGQLGAVLSLDRALLEDCTEVGISVYGGSVATLRDVRVSRIATTRCADAMGGCTEGAGIGLLALVNGTIDAERFVIEEAALAGIIIVENSSLDLRDGTVRHSPIGINIQDPEFDLGRVTDRVLFTGNGRNLDSTALPVPSATADTSDETP